MPDEALDSPISGIGDIRFNFIAQFFQHLFAAFLTPVARRKGVNHHAPQAYPSVHITVKVMGMPMSRFLYIEKEEAQDFSSILRKRLRENR